VKVAGRRIELGEIEARFLQHHGVRECVVDLVDPVALRAAKRLGALHRVAWRPTYGDELRRGGRVQVAAVFDAYVDKAQAYFKTRMRSRPPSRR